MTANLIRFQLLLEFFIYWLILWWDRPTTMTVGEMLLYMFAFALALRFLLVVISYAFAATWRSVPPREMRAGFSSRVWAFFAEWIFLVLLSMVVMPFDSWWMPERGKLRRPANGRPPILLVHGYLATAVYWVWVKRQLEAQGWTVATLTLRPLFADIDSYSAQVEKRIKTVLAETGTSQLILIGHSMGGLVARSYLRQFGSAKIARLITLGSPHRGSRLAVLGPGQNGRQMRVDSDWLRAINARGAVPLPPTVAIYSYGDNFVMPQESARLPELSDERHIALPAVGHAAMAFSPHVLEAVLNALNRDF